MFASLVCGGIGLIASTFSLVGNFGILGLTVGIPAAVVGAFAPRAADLPAPPRLSNSIIDGLIVAIGITLVNILPDYVSLLETRIVLELMRRSILPVILGLLIDVVSTAATALIWNGLLFSRHSTDIGTTIVRLGSSEIVRRWVLYPALFTSVWLWLYAGSGFLLKAARRFDMGFQWFNRHMDIEKKRLQSIGLVAGAIVACVYWAAAFVMRFTA